MKKDDVIIRVYKISNLRSEKTGYAAAMMMKMIRRLKLIDKAPNFANLPKICLIVSFLAILNPPECIQNQWEIIQDFGIRSILSNNLFAISIYTKIEMYGKTTAAETSL